MSDPVSAASGARIHGKTYGEWSAGWWQWQEANFPGFSFGEGTVDCSLGQSGPVWFLGGTGGGVAVRACAEPLGKHTHLFIPLVNANLFNPDPWCSSDDPPDPNAMCTARGVPRGWSPDATALDRFRAVAAGVTVR